VRTLACVVLSAGLGVLVFPPFDLAALSWVVLVPLLLAVRGRGAKAAAGLAALCTYIATVAIIAWLVPTLRDHFERSAAQSIAFVLLFGAVAASPYYAAAFALNARARPRLPRALAPLLLPLAWVAAEYGRTQLGFESPWAKLGDVHYASARLRLVADVAGVYGVSGLVVLGNVAVTEVLAEGWEWWRGRRFDRVAPAVCAGAFALLCSAALLYGEARRTPEAPSAAALEVVVVQGNVAPELRWKRPYAARVVRRYSELTRNALAASSGDLPDLVVWPENALQTSLDDPIYGPPVRALVRGGVPLLLGAPRSELTNGHRRHFNSAFLLRADQRVEHYDKRRLLPFSETRPLGELGRIETRGDLDAREYSAGEHLGLFSLEGHVLATLICFEAIYPEMAREAARHGASVLVNLSNDGWYRGRGGARQHLAQAVFRAVETGLPLIRATTTGISAVVAPDGTIVAELGEDVTDTLRVSVPPARPGSTLYTRLGDSFAIGCVLACLCALLVSFGRGRGEEHAGPGPAESSPSSTR